MTVNSKPTALKRRLRAGLMAASLAAVVGGATMAPALADDYWHRDHDRFAREHWREHERWEHRRFAYAAPGYYHPYVYQPYVAPGYAYAPAYPVAPSFNVVVPLHIR